MTVLALVHAPDCPQPSPFYAVRNGWIWAACRYCNRTVVRPPAKETTR